MSGTIISLSTPDLDWEQIAWQVEYTGKPVWLELGGAIQGVLLPVVDAQRLLGHFARSLQGAQTGDDQTAAHPPPDVASEPYTMP